MDFKIWPICLFVMVIFGCSQPSLVNDGESGDTLESPSIENKTSSNVGGTNGRTPYYPDFSYDMLKDTWDTEFIGSDNGCNEKNLFHSTIGWQSNTSCTAVPKNAIQWGDMKTISFIKIGSEVIKDINAYVFGVDNPFKWGPSFNKNLDGTYRVQLWSGNYGETPFPSIYNSSGNGYGYYSGAEIGFYKFDRRITDLFFGAWYPVEKSDMEFILVNRSLGGSNGKVVVSNSANKNGDGNETWWLTSWNGDKNRQYASKDLDLYFRVKKFWGSKWMKWKVDTNDIVECDIGLGAWSEVGDFNGDGKEDVLRWSGDGNIWIGTSTGSTINWSLQGNAWPFIPNASNTWRFTGDFNGDGKTDIGFWYGGDGNIWIGTSTGSTINWSLQCNNAWPFIPNASNTWRFTGDFNGDGKTDTGFWYGGDGNIWIGTSTGSNTNFTYFANKMLK